VRRRAAACTRGREEKKAHDVPIPFPSGTRLARRGRQERRMTSLLTGLGIALIAIGIVASAMTMSREGSRF